LPFQFRDLQFQSLARGGCRGNVPARTLKRYELPLIGGIRLGFAIQNPILPSIRRASLPGLPRQALTDVVIISVLGAPGSGKGTVARPLAAPGTYTAPEAAGCYTAWLHRR
jgi:hypothetical protein